MYAQANAPAILDTLPETDGGLDAVRKTLRLMVAIVRRYRTDAACVNIARQILVGRGIRDVRHEKPNCIRHLHGWVRDTIVYVPDPQEVELLQTPPQTLTIGTGDCDDKAMLLATLLATCGFATRFKAVGGIGEEWSGQEDEPGESGDPSYTHVFAEVRLGTRWLGLDAIVATSYPGWEPPNIGCLMVAHV
jgi:transglutaminase-like putative cysteine protease